MGLVKKGLIGGIVFGIIGLIIGIISLTNPRELLDIPIHYIPANLSLIIIAVFFDIFTSSGYLFPLFFLVISFIFYFFIGFIIGALIGWIVGKIKSRKTQVVTK